MRCALLLVSLSTLQTSRGNWTIRSATRWVGSIKRRIKNIDFVLFLNIGTATTVLPPDHPSTEGAPEDAECPVTKAKIAHHKGKVHGHPDLKNVSEGAICPVAGKYKSEMAGIGA